MNDCEEDHIISDKMQIPDWFNESYIEEALQDYHKDKSLKIQDCNITAALAKGENYGGVLTRIKVNYELNKGLQNRTEHFIGKTSYEADEFAKEKMRPYDIFNREISIYEKVIPELKNLLKGINDNEEIFAKTIYMDYKHNALIFEDITAQGYVMPDRTQGLDEVHIILILRKLAKMHATSAVFNERCQGCLEKYDRGFFNRYTNSYSTGFLGNLKACAQLISQWPDYEYYSAKLTQLHSNYMNIGLACFTPISGQVNVLCHGDLWTNNVMFKYDKKSGRPLDVLIIDFQYSVWGSPALDLHYFLNTSLREDIRLSGLDVYYEYYHKKFSTTLKKLNYYSNPVPSLHKFILQLENKRFMGKLIIFPN